MTNFLTSRHDLHNTNHRDHPRRHRERHRKPTRDQHKTRNQLTPSKLTITSSVTATESATSTTIVTRTSEAPRAFYLVFPHSSSSFQYGHISRPTDRPGSSGTLIGFREQQISADFFSLNAQKQLVTYSDGLVLEKNSRDPYPFLFLDNSTTAANTPVFSVCSGLLSANYPGTQGNGFGLCDGLLSLGVDSILGAPSCQRINLGFAEVPLSQNQRD